MADEVGAVAGALATYADAAEKAAALAKDAAQARAEVEAANNSVVETYAAGVLCKDCPAAFYQPDVRQAICIACEAGVKYVRFPDCHRRAVAACTVPRKAVVAHHHRMHLCPPCSQKNTFQNLTQQGSCRDCPPRHYSLPKATQCLACHIVPWVQAEISVETCTDCSGPTVAECVDAVCQSQVALFIPLLFMFFAATTSSTSLHS